mmetsp:Transcript_14450/g.42654  ORF Transcript_14450/g.42654 Transcript_14450/m.42654 type:complete len:234 (+) Transcript_14450:682-1383(+)
MVGGTRYLQQRKGVGTHIASRLFVPQIASSHLRHAVPAWDGGLRCLVGEHPRPNFPAWVVGLGCRPGARPLPAWRWSNCPWSTQLWVRLLTSSLHPGQLNLRVQGLASSLPPVGLSIRVVVHPKGQLPRWCVLGREPASPLPHVRGTVTAFHNGLLSRPYHHSRSQRQIISISTYQAFSSVLVWLFSSATHECRILLLVSKIRLVVALELINIGFSGSHVVFRVVTPGQGSMK